MNSKKIKINISFYLGNMRIQNVEVALKYPVSIGLLIQNSYTCQSWATNNSKIHLFNIFIFPLTTSHKYYLWTVKGRCAAMINVSVWRLTITCLLLWHLSYLISPAYGDIHHAIKLLSALNLEIINLCIKIHQLCYCTHGMEQACV